MRQRLASLRPPAARHLDLPVAAIPLRTLPSTSPGSPGLLAADSPASSTLTRELVKWQPTHAGLIDDLDPGHYVDNPSA